MARDKNHPCIIMWSLGNEGARGLNMRAMRDAAKNRIVENRRIEQKGEDVLIVYEMKLPDVGASYTLSYKITNTGRIQVEADYQPQKTDTDIQLIPKFGLRMRLFSEMNEVSWYGRGEFENYPDRKTAALLGIYHKPLDEFITDYVVPQDNANRCDVRWFSMTNERNHGIKVTGLQSFCFRAWPYSEEDLEEAKHPHELPQRDYINVNMDLSIHGVGGNDSWGAKTWKKYTIDGNTPHHFGLILEAID